MIISTPKLWPNYDLKIQKKLQTWPKLRPPIFFSDWNLKFSIKKVARKLDIDKKIGILYYELLAHYTLENLEPSIFHTMHDYDCGSFKTLTVKMVKSSKNCKALVFVTPVGECSWPEALAIFFLTCFNSYTEKTFGTSRVLIKHK